jgi:diguanylate cyclase (GGDEF)-like protein/PAS domain S-box-containing protein
MMLTSTNHMLTLALVLALAALALTSAGTVAEQSWRRRRTSRAEAAAGQWSRQLAEAALEGLVVHQSGNILQINGAAARLLGRRPREMLGQNLANFALEAQIPALRAAVEAPQPGLAEFTLLRADKVEVKVELASQTIAFEGLPATVTALRDITQRLADAARIQRLLLYDSLTDLPNRQFFSQRLREAIGRNDRAGGTTALFAIDIDQFKTLNERFGRAGGDQLLRQVAERIRGLLGPEDLLARLGSDKFGIMLESTGAANRAVMLSGQLEAAFAAPFIAEGQSLTLSASVGIAIFPDHATDAEELIKAGDAALRQAARAGGGRCQMFSHAEAAGQRVLRGGDGHRAGFSDPQTLMSDLRGALAAGEISLSYQPVFRGGDLALVGFEALPRWRHRQDVKIPAAVFMPLAEQLSLIQEIGGFVLETACRAAVQGAAPLRVSVALSSEQFRDPSLPGRVAAILRATGLSPGRLELELTEKLLIDDPPAAARALQALRAVGVSLTLGEFGGASATLGDLADLPFARLKIDRRFIAALGTDANADAIVAAILALAGNLRLEVTAAGVETEAQLAQLRRQGCHQMQGYLLGRPAARIEDLPRFAMQGLESPTNVLPLPVARH